VLAITCGRRDRHVAEASRRSIVGATVDSIVGGNGCDMADPGEL